MPRPARSCIADRAARGQSGCRTRRPFSGPTWRPRPPPMAAGWRTVRAPRPLDATRSRPTGHRGDQPGNAGDHAGPAVGARPGGSESAGAVHQRDLFFQRHLLHDHVGPLVRREARVHPRTLGACACLCAASGESSSANRATAPAKRTGRLDSEERFIRSNPDFTLETCLRIVPQSRRMTISKLCGPRWLPCSLPFPANMAATGDYRKQPDGIVLQTAEGTLRVQVVTRTSSA